MKKFSQTSKSALISLLNAELMCMCRKKEWVATLLDNFYCFLIQFKWFIVQLKEIKSLKMQLILKWFIASLSLSRSLWMIKIHEQFLLRKRSFSDNSTIFTWQFFMTSFVHPRHLHRYFSLESLAPSVFAFIRKSIFQVTADVTTANDRDYDYGGGF